MRMLLMFLAVAAMAVIPVAAAQQAQSTQSTKTPAPAGKAAKSSAASIAPVNLNTATQAQLEALPGVGPKAAQRVLEYRKQNGPFKKIEDLMNVKGFGEKTFLKLKPMLTVGEKAGAN